MVRYCCNEFGVNEMRCRCEYCMSCLIKQESEYGELCDGCTRVVGVSKQEYDIVDRSKHQVCGVYCV